MSLKVEDFFPSQDSVTNKEEYIEFVMNYIPELLHASINNSWAALVLNNPHFKGDKPFSTELFRDYVIEVVDWGNYKITRKQ